MRTCLLTLILIAFTALPVQADLPSNIRKLIDWETQANGAGSRPSGSISLEYFEIPLSEVNSKISQSLDENTRASLIFEKNGKEYIHWIINPDDYKYKEALKTHLLSKGLDANPVKGRFDAYRTASRSLILHDLENGAIFSAKVGTDGAGGQWQDKPLTVQQAKQTALIDKELSQIDQALAFKNLQLMSEPAAFMLEGADQGLVVRSLDVLASNPKKYYLPAFSAVHESVGKNLAQLSGATDAAVFWKSHAVHAIAKAQAEFVAFTGRVPEAGHWQNYLIELDENYKPTGKIVMRDFSDSDILRGFHKQLADQTSLSEWAQNHVKNNIWITHGPLHGNKFPGWLSDQAYLEWHTEFYSAFESEFKSITGIDLSQYRRQVNETLSGGNHYKLSRTSGVNEYHMLSQDFERYFSLAECFRGASFTGTGQPCPPEIKEKLRRRPSPVCNYYMR